MFSLARSLREGQVQRQAYPEFFSFTRNKMISFHRASLVEHFHHQFHLPLSEEAFIQMGVLHELINNQVASHTVDRWTYIWGGPFFYSEKAYKQLIGHAQVHHNFLWIWKSSYQNKHKVFFWLLLKDHLSTRNSLRRKTMIFPSYDCVLCADTCEETMEHLVLHCSFANNC